MKAIEGYINELKRISQNPVKSIEAGIKETGKRAVGCFPIYTPDEIVYAAGALPIGMWGGPFVGNMSDKYFQTFCCSLIKANTEQALKGVYDMLSAVIITAFCDTLKCTLENWKTAVPHLSIIPIVYPQNRKTDAGKQFLVEELIRVKEEIERILSVKISEKDLENSFELYEEYRRTMRQFVETAVNYPSIFDAVSRHQIIKAAYFMDKSKYTEIVKNILIELSSMPVEKTNYKKVIITGLLAEPDEFLNLFDENGLVIAADDLAQESRQFRTEAPWEGTPFERMAGRMALQEGCPFLFDRNKRRGSMLIDLKNKYNAQGIVYCQLKFCDPEEFDYPIIKKEMEEAGIPVLYLEIEQQMDSVEQLRTRIQTFSEIL
ncbi:MAG: 2-hydroxyacyl-CoA dehydratase family protein [Anaerovoracaceae bacterium]